MLKEFRPSLNDSRFAGIHSYHWLLFSTAVLLAMPAAYLFFGGWVLLAVWMYVFGQVVVSCQGLAILIRCGVRNDRGKAGWYGIGLCLYGAASLALLFFLACLAAFGGPPWQGSVTAFYLALWLCAAVLCVPAAICLRRWGRRLSQPRKEK